MKTALRIAALCLALCAGLLLAAMLVFGGPNYFGLRPHAVKPGLESHHVSDLTSLASNGPVNGILTYDAWYKGRKGKTGWFVLPAAQISTIGFSVNGALDPQMAKVFGAGPRRCNGTSLPEKMIRAVEPERIKSGFLGRSTCKRSKMDIQDVIAASSPAARHNAQMTHQELTEFDAQENPMILRDNVPAWPTPYAYHMIISLPVIWQDMNIRPEFSINDFRNIASDLADALNREGFVGVRLQLQEWYPRHFTEARSNHLPFEYQDETIMLSGIRFSRFDFVVLCALEARKDCDGIDVSALLVDVKKLHDRDVLNAALAKKLSLPDESIGLRDVLTEIALERDRLTSPTSKERRFSVTWYDGRAPSTLN